MYTKEQSPLGLYIENGRALAPMNTKKGEGNFYLKPNGVFYLTKKHQAVITTTDYFKKDSSVLYATQSGPMLVIDGAIHTEFTKGSSNVNVRNGVGILPNGHVLFAMSKKEINLYDFAKYFQDLGCKQALYLDGFVSRTYLPSKNWLQTDGQFGVIIGVVK
jgi:uncharacterized protein YigE (DUF2233 family)